MTHNTKELELQLKHPVGVSLARAIPYVNQNQIVEVSTQQHYTKKSESHWPIYDPQYKRGRAPIKKHSNKKFNILKKIKYK